MFVHHNNDQSQLHNRSHRSQENQSTADNNSGRGGVGRQWFRKISGHSQSQHSGSCRTKRQLAPEPVVTKSKSQECNGRRSEAQMRRISAKARHYGSAMATEWFGPMSQSTENQCTVEANRQQTVWPLQHRTNLRTGQRCRNMHDRSIRDRWERSSWRRKRRSEL
jgi:hypothetical protein